VGLVAHMPCAASHPERARVDPLPIRDILGVRVADDLERVVAAYGASDDGRGGDARGARHGRGSVPVAPVSRPGLLFYVRNAEGFVCVRC
jgi:hypothetical protein